MQACFREFAREILAPATVAELIFGAIFLCCTALLVVGAGGGPH